MASEDDDATAEADLPGDMGNEPIDGSYPPDHEDLLDALDAPQPSRTGRAGSNELVKQRGPTKSNKIIAKERQRRAMEMRKAGVPFQVIADNLGYSSASGAYNAVKRGMDTMLPEVADELRLMQYERLNHMLMVRWPGVQQGDDIAINTCLRIMDKMDRLMGTDTPPDVNVHHTVEGAVIVGQVDRDSYINAMKALAIDADSTVGIPPQALDQAPAGFIDQHVDDIDKVIDAELAEEMAAHGYVEAATVEEHSERTTDDGDQAAQPPTFDTTPRRTGKQGRDGAVGAVGPSEVSDD